MDRNGNLLKLLFTSIAFATLVNCLNKKKGEDDTIYDSDTKYLSLSAAVGTYYFIPSAKDNEYPNYKTFNLKKGDTIKLEIKSDSSFLFNHLYYNKEFGNIQISSIDNYIGKITTNLDYKDKIFIPFPDDSFDVQGFLISEKDTIFFNRLSMEHYNNYEYRIFYKKMK